MSDNVVLTLINQESEDLDIPGVVSKEERAVESTFIGDDLESTSDGDIEIENLVDDGLDQGGEDGGDNNPLTHITFDVRKRTLIMLWQRTILEDYYRNGMTSASMQLHSLHQAAAEKTGLDHTVVKNWIRNRRRPAAIKSAEKLAEKINHGELPTYSSSFTVGPLVSSATQPPPPAPITATPLLMQPRPPSSGHTHLTLSTGTPVSSVLGVGGALVQHGSFGVPDAKRLCYEPNSSALTSPRHFLSSITTSGSTQQQSLLSSLSPQPTFMVKIRVFGSGESDFYEVELQALNYESLLKSCAEELEVDISQISKIRKLPNILIRRDRDVLRLKDGQELEIVLNDNINQLNVNNSSSGLAMLNLPLSNDMPSLSGNVGIHQTSLHANGIHPIS